MLGAMQVLEDCGGDAVVATILPDSNKDYLSTDLCRAEPGAAPPTPDGIRAREETRRLVIDAALALREPYRGTVVLHYLGQPVRELAARQSVPLETVRTRLRRALEQLREALRARRGRRQRRRTHEMPHCLAEGCRPRPILPAG